MKWVKVFDLLDWNANDEKVLEKKSEITSFKGVAEKVNDYIDQYKCGSVDFYVILPSSIFDLSGGQHYPFPWAVTS